MFTMEQVHKHTWKFLKSSTITFEFNSFRVDRYVCTVCEKVYSIDRDTGERINLRGMVGEEA